MPLRSGEPEDTQWVTVNRQGAQGGFHKGEIISARDAIENRRSRMIIGDASSPSQPNDLYCITAIGANTLTCTDLTSGASVTVYKDVELQGGMTGETIYGDAVTYSSYGTSYNVRTATDSSSNTEAQYMTPEYVVGNVICAITVNGYSTSILSGAGGSLPSGTSYPSSGTFLLEVKPRQWGGVNT